jgi:hypothetical protein
MIEIAHAVISPEASMLQQEAIARILAHEGLSLDDSKAIMRFVRYGRGRDESVDYANTILPGAGDYLPPYWLRALVRADVTEREASRDLERSRAFFGRLVSLLSPLLRFFSAEERATNLSGIIASMDSCHDDFHFIATSSRKDRQVREMKQKLAKASKLANDLAAVLEDTRKHYETEFQRYYAVRYPARHVDRYVSDLIDELKMCGGVTEIANASMDVNPKGLLLFGNDARNDVVEAAYRMCTILGGPKLVTTTGSDFSAFCSLLFEAVSGKAEEGLSGAINRYARSDERAHWYREGEYDEDDNFLNQKNAMRFSVQQIELSRKLLRDASLSDMAKLLLRTRIDYEQEECEKARTQYGPNQVHLSQMNKEQFMNIVLEAYNRWTPEQRLEFDEHMSSGKTQVARDIALGQSRRSARGGKIDV